MTDNEIIKALDCCNRIGGSCEICPLYQGTLYCGTASCIKNLTLNALDLISRQREENERLLQKLQQAKSKAIKEFAERLKKELRLDDDCSYDCENCCFECKEFVPQIDDLVKQMTEVQE